MICSKCQYYTILIEDDEDVSGTPWCLLADDALPDDVFAPFECICPDRKEQIEKEKEIEEGLAESEPMNNGLSEGLIDFSALTEEGDNFNDTTKI